MEAGLPLTEAERDRMPDADTVWLTPLAEMLACLERRRAGRPLAGGLQPVPPRHGGFADRRVRRRCDDIAAQIGRRALEELLAAHRLWSDWLREGRVRKVAFVAEKTRPRRPTRTEVPASGRS